MRRLLLPILTLMLAGHAAWAAEDVCGLLARQLAGGQLETLRAGDLSAPHDGPDREAVIALIGPDEYQRHFFDQHAIERQRLDIDGDGERDHVFLQNVGGEHCPHLTIYRGGRQTSLLAAVGSQSWCGWRPFFMPQRGGATRLVAEDPSGSLDVARYVPGQGFQRECTVSVAWTGAPEMDASGCTDPLCPAVANTAGGALRDPLALSSGRPGSLDFVRDGRYYRTDGGVYVDIDNDGVEDYIKPGRGAQNQLYWEIYARDGGKSFTDVDPGQRWMGFEQLTSSRQWLPFFDGEKLDIVRAGGRTLLLGITKDRTDSRFQDRRAYRIAVYIIDNNVLQPLGTLLATDRPSIKVERCSGDCSLPTE
jgi:hypothetical protein